LVHSRAQAQDYPSQTITIVVSIGAGTGMDVWCGSMPRSFGSARQAGGGREQARRRDHAGRAQVATAPPDGHTLVVLTSAALAINQSLYKQINYSPENDFVPIRST
jgi:tripartite-type tricarboxylate transporter receptor subunit TctC